ncbi:MAG TPA: ROK family protein [Terriglobia bacterium]|nr:ROK family protein [Terriglobia bacterium]
MPIGAVDIGGTKTAAGLVDESGRLLSKVEAPTETENYELGLNAIVTMLREASRAANAPISGIGVGSTGPVNPLTGELGEIDFLPSWRGKPLVEDLQRAFQVKTALENDADAAALGEAAWGAGQRKTRLIHLTIGTGIGGGVILDGRLYRGVGGAHPELGHHVVDPSGPLCSCGFRGCWESLASGPAMAAWLESQTPESSAPRERLTAKRICQLALQGDMLASRAVEREAYYLGLGLANLINCFCPDAIVLSGGLMKSAALFLDPIRRVIATGCRFVPIEKTEVALASLGEDAGLIGAASVWLYREGRLRESPRPAQEQRISS